MPRRIQLLFISLYIFFLFFTTYEAFVSNINYKWQRTPLFLHRRAPVCRTALQMNLAERFIRVAKANLNQLLNTVEDPEKVLEQAVLDMQKDLIKVRQSYAEVTASCKRMEKQQATAEGLADEWYKRAELALSRDDDELAREALTRRQQQSEVAQSIAQQLETQRDALGKLYESMVALESKITEAKAKKDMLVARARTAKTSSQVNDMLSNVGGEKGLDAFNRMEEKVEMLESKAEVSRTLTGGAVDINLEDRFKALEGGSKVDDELAKMKGKLLGGGSTKFLNQAIDDEIENIKKAKGRD